VVSSQLRISDTNSTWQIAPYWIELRGFTKIAVYGVDDEGRKHGVIVRFANVGDSWKFAESVPGLRWTYWDPLGRLEAIPVKIKKYRRPRELALSAGVTVGSVGLFLWLLFYYPFIGAIEIGATSLLHLPTLAISKDRQKQKKGHVLAETDQVVITTGNIVWFEPELSERRTRNPKQLVVKTGPKTFVIEFANQNEAANGLRLIRKDLHGLQGLVDATQAA
jgi:hypothetical protein